MPLAAFLVVGDAPLFGVGYATLVGAVVAAFGVAYFSARPARAIALLLLFLPYQVFGMALLYSYGMPAELVRAIRLYPLLLATSVFVAALRVPKANRRPIDWLDRFVLAYIGIVVVYFFVPGFFSDYAISGDARQLALRADIFFPALLIACRRLSFDEATLTRLRNVAIISATIVALIGLYEYAFPDSWTDFVRNTVRINQYRIQILNGSALALPLDRVGSVLFSGLELPHYLVLPIALCAGCMVRGGAPRWIPFAGYICALALVTTLTRSAVLATVIAMIAVLLPAARQQTGPRVRYIAVACVGLFLAVPLIASSGLADRVGSTPGAQDESTQDHIASFWDGVGVLAEEPLGRGLGTQPGIGDRAAVSGTVTSENYYLQVGNELGIVPFVLFIGFTILMVRRLAKANRIFASALMPGVAAAGFGYMVGAFFLHIWTDYIVSWPFWMLAGLALAAAELSNVPVTRTQPATASAVRSNGAPRRRSFPR